MNINYDSIKYFICVAKHGSLSKAAYSLGISQSALSQSMKNLEYSLGVTLFNRNTRGIILTEEGKLLFEEASIGNEYFENAIIQLMRISKFETLKSFKIGTSGTLMSNFISPIMKDLVKKYPNINFELSSYVRDTKVVESLQSGKIDLAIIKTSDNFFAKEVVVKTIKELNYYLVYNPKYFNFKHTEKLEDLKDYPIIMKRRTGRLDNSWIQASFSYIVTCESDRSILELIKNGVGLGIYPEEFVKKEGLNIIKTEDFFNIKRKVSGVYLENNKIALDIVNTIIRYK